MRFNMSASSGMNNLTRGRSGMDLAPKAYRIAWCSLYVVEAVLIIAANLLTVILFVMSKKLRKKSLLLVINMAFADLMFGAVLPLRIYFLGGYYQLWTPGLHRALRNFCDVSEKVFLRVSFTSAALISCERFYAIYWPLKHRTVTSRVYYAVIPTVWILTAVLSTVLFPRLRLLTLNVKLTTHVFASYFLTLLVIVCGCNIGIWRTFHRQSIASQQQNKAIRKQRLTKTLLFVSVVAVLAWLPYIISKYLGLRSSISSTSKYIFQMALGLSYSNSFLNAVVYVFRIPEFKQALVSRCFKRSRAVMIKESDERRDNKAAAAALTKPRTVETDSSHVSTVENVAFEHEVMDTKL